jgi:hypothetical protein
MLPGALPYPGDQATTPRAFERDHGAVFLDDRVDLRLPRGDEGKDGRARRRLRERADRLRLVLNEGFRSVNDHQPATSEQRRGLQRSHQLGHLEIVVQVHVRERVAADLDAQLRQRFLGQELLARQQIHRRGHSALRPMRYSC